MDAFKLAFVQADSDATGLFTLHHVPDAGAFRLVARLSKAGPVGKLAVTVAGADQTGLTIALEKRGSIAGRVIDTDGLAVRRHAEGARARGVRRPRPARPCSMSGMGETGATSGDDGSFKLVGLDAGSYVLDTYDADSIADMMESRSRKQPDPIVLAAGAEHTGAVVTVPAKNGVLRGVWSSTRATAASRLTRG